MVALTLSLMLNDFNNFRSARLTRLAFTETRGVWRVVWKAFQNVKKASFIPEAFSEVFDAIEQRLGTAVQSFKH